MSTSGQVCKQKAGAGGRKQGLTIPFFLLLALLLLSKDLRLTQASPVPFLHPVNIVGLFSHEYGFPSSLTVGMDVGGRAVDYISSQSLPISREERWALCLFSQEPFAFGWASCFLSEDVWTLSTLNYFCIRLFLCDALSLSKCLDWIRQIALC